MEPSGSRVEAASASVDRLAAAINAHDLAALVSCFHTAFVNETPAHPDRSFAGVAQVRENWARIFAGVPDLHATIVGRTVDGAAAWTEWDWTGTRRDGTPHHMRGVTITTVEDQAISRVRFYMEQVTDEGLGVTAAIDAVVAGAASPVAAGSPR